MFGMGILIFVCFVNVFMILFVLILLFVSILFKIGILWLILNSVRVEFLIRYFISLKAVFLFLDFVEMNAVWILINDGVGFLLFVFGSGVIVNGIFVFIKFWIFYGLLM